MIKQIIFERTDSFKDNKLILDFSKNINVIIGPKGGGKSTLFDLLACIKLNFISNSVIQALEAYKLKFIKAIKFNNEEVLVSQLPKRTLKQRNEIFAQRNNIIFQDDPIKKDLTSDVDIEKRQFEYTKQQIYKSQDVSKYIDKIHEFYNSMSYLDQLNKDNTINWSNTFKITELDEGKDSLKPITNLDYKKTSITNLIKEENYEFFDESVQDFKNRLSRVQRISNNLNIWKDKQYSINVNKLIETIASNITELLKLLNQRKELLLKIQNTIDAFSNAYRLTIDHIKNENYSSSGLNNYVVSAKNYFKNFAIVIHKASDIYHKIQYENVYLNIENNKEQSTNFVFKINQNIEVKDELKFEILKAVLPSPGNVQNDINKWLKVLAEKGIKEFDEDKILNAISRSIKGETKIWVDFGDELKEYDKLSLGQKSIYGLKYKFNRSLNEDLFMDQPEDNLDNNTITSEILNLFDKKKDNQVFVVTHNANIGILSNPSQVIVANLSDKKNPYKISNVAEVINNESANYLEGGKVYLEKRYDKIIKNKGEK